MKRPIGTLTLPQRTAKILPETDVLIVGGGPAGLAAALGAADAGAKVSLVERYSFLGGNATAGLVLTFASYYTSPQLPLHAKPKELTLFPTDHGTGKPIIGGVLADLVERLIQAGGAFEPSPKTGFMVPFDPEIFKIEALNMVDSAGVDFLFNAFASGVTTDSDGVKGVIFETKSGPLVAPAKVVIDCTGDGDVASYAGAPFEIGRSKDNLVQPMALMFMVENFRYDKFNMFVQTHPTEWHGIQGLSALMREAEAKGELNIPERNRFAFWKHT